MDDKTTLRILHHEGFRKLDKSLKSLRKREGMYRSKSGRGAITDDDLSAIIADALETGVIENYGRTMLHSHFRKMGIIVGR